MSAIQDMYTHLRPETRRELGDIIGTEIEDTVGGGRYLSFTFGAIYWHPSSGAHEVHGEIYKKWRKLGLGNSTLGYPITNEQVTVDGKGRYNDFMGGSIYWSEESGPYSVYGPMRQKWYAMGGTAGGLGYPLSEASIVAGEIRQSFQGGIVCWSPQTGVFVIPETHGKKIKYIRVFLTRYEDISNPPNYTKQYFENLMFSANGADTNPDGGPISGTVFDYFFGISDGNVILTGDVNDWTTVPFSLTKLVHWRVGLQPVLPAVDTFSGTIVATLRENNIHSKEDLKIDGKYPEGLVFLHLDVRGGGALRSMLAVKGSIHAYQRPDLWDPAWDGWLEMPVVCVPVTQLDPEPEPLIDGTIEHVPAVSQLRWFSTQVIIHELGHLLLAYPDLYGDHSAYWGQMELMSSSARNDFPPYIGSYLQEYGGWFNPNEMPSHTHRGLRITPLETHNIAFRFANGSMNSRESITLENRQRLDYQNVPPTVIGNVLMAYRIITMENHFIASQGVPIRRAFMYIRRPEPWGEAWGINGHNDITGQGPEFGNSLNHLGERWWEFVNLQVLPDGSMELDSIFQPFDLIQSYAQASWTNGDGEIIIPDLYNRQKGSVMMVNYSPPIENGLRYNHVLKLHPQNEVNGELKGRYSIVIPNEGSRLYLTVALPDNAQDNAGFIFRVLLHEAGQVRTLGEVDVSRQRNIRTVVVDMNDYRGSTRDITLELNSGPTQEDVFGYLIEALMVPTSATVFDFVTESDSAVWRGNDGNITFGADWTPMGAAQKRRFAKLQNGIAYGEHALVMYPLLREHGVVEGVYRITLPLDRTVFRAEVGYEENNLIPMALARISLTFVADPEPSDGIEMNTSVRTVLLSNLALMRNPLMGEIGLLQNPLATIAVSIPENLRGKSGEFIIRIEVTEVNQADWIWWTVARLTRD